MNPNTTKASEQGMDLKQYEHAKFELSAILRSVALGLEERDTDLYRTIEGLFGRLAEDRFNLVVVGRFSRGKTSLMNALLESERLPMSIVPLTSVITTVAYGSNECVFIEYEGRGLSSEIPLTALSEYITQQGNPGNRRHVAMARVEMPSEILRRGFYFVDTPGLGSTIIENTRTTERFLPEADAFMVVTSYDSPLSTEELAILESVASSAHPVFLILNKHDLASAAERAAVIAHVRLEAQRIGATSTRLYSISAGEALEARRRGDSVLMADSGLPTLRAELIDFLLHEKQSQFLLRMCNRVGDVLRQLSNSGEAIQRLRTLEQQLGEYIPYTALASPDGSVTDAKPRFIRCPICDRLDRDMYAFLCQYQYDVLAGRDLQAGLAERGGLCEFHTWKYAAVASPRGTCVGFSSVLERLASRLREVAVSDVDSRTARLEELRPENCDLCQTRARLESMAVDESAGRLAADSTQVSRFSGVCVPHLRMLAHRLADGELLAKLIVRQADAMERVSEDMQRYALKHDGIRRFLASGEELIADQRALLLLAGSRTLNGG